MPPLTADAVAAYERDGFLFPVDAIPPEQARRARAQVDDVVGSVAPRKRRLASYLRGAAHLVLPAVHELVRDDAVLDPVESLLGPDLMVWEGGLFIKEAGTPQHVTWHQDLNYWGLDGVAEVTAWIALSPATAENGAMRFLPGSHKAGGVRHRDTFEPANMLTRGQAVAEEVDESASVTVTLASGQMSLHHGRLFHASGPNASRRRRIGLAVRYIRPSMRQVVGPTDYASLVRGEDRHGHFKPQPAPAFDLEPDRLAAIDAMLAAQDAYYYAGAAQRPRRGRHAGPASG